MSFRVLELKVGYDASPLVVEAAVVTSVERDDTRGSVRQDLQPFCGYIVQIRNENSQHLHFRSVFSPNLRILQLVKQPEKYGQR